MRKLLFVFIMIAGMRCSHSTRQEGYRLVKVDDITITTKELAYVNPSNIQLVESDSGRYLFCYNSIGKNYLYMDFETGDIKVKIPVSAKDGPNSLRGLTGAVLTGMDSIWVTFAPAAIGLINFKGELLLKRKVENELFPVSALMSEMKRPLFKIGDKIYGPQPYFMNHHGMEKSDIRKHQLIYSYDMVKDSIAWYDVFYADDYWDKGKKLTDYSWAASNDKIILAPLYDHEMQVFDIPSGQVIDRKSVKSDMVSNFNYVNTLPTNSTNGIFNRLKFDRYGTIIYDPYRNVFYRLYNPGFEPEEDYPIEKKNMMDLSRPYLGVLILDEDLNPIGEHKFQKNEVYTFSNHFVGEKGLYISTNNLFNEDFSEDSFRYAVFSLEKQ